MGSSLNPKLYCKSKVLLRPLGGVGVFGFKENVFKLSQLTKSKKRNNGMGHAVKFIIAVCSFVKIERVIHLALKNKPGLHPSSAACSWWQAAAEQRQQAHGNPPWREGLKGWEKRYRVLFVWDIFGRVVMICEMCGRRLKGGGK